MLTKIYCKKCKFFAPYHFPDGSESSSFFCNKKNGYFCDCDRTEKDWCYEGMPTAEEKLIKIMLSGMVNKS